MRLVTACLLLFAQSSLAETLYKCVDEQGVVIYNNVGGSNCAVLARVPGDSLDLRRWKFVAESSPPGSMIWIDKKSIVKTKDQITAWYISSFSKAPSSQLYPYVVYLSDKSQLINNCRERTQARIQTIYYDQMDAKGSVVWSLTLDPKKVVMSSVAPETIGEMMLEMACK